ncbi:MAG: aminotransferase class V-fold PLP-dependent enzyme [Flavobacteriales bacterium]|nr:aminotransferase class V-fold PLP-dependent enzyme [Flavobacteriales bacterium]
MNIQDVRYDTPACEKNLFLNSAGSSLPPTIVNKTIYEYLRSEEEVGGYKLMEIKAVDINGFYSSSAKLIGASPRNMAFANSATDAYGKALTSIPFVEGDVIITTDDDYISNFIQFDQLTKRFGIGLKRIQNLENGDLDLDHLIALIEEKRPKLVAITHIPTNSGLIQDAESVGAICKRYDILYLLDACQSVGQLEVDVKKIGCDFLSVTGRKFMRAPRGTGFLYASDRVLELGYAPLVMDSFGASWEAPMRFELKDDAKRFELWEKSEALKLGMKAAIDYAIDVGLGNIAHYNTTLRNHLLERIRQLSGVYTLDKGTNKANIVTVKKEGVDLNRFQAILDKNDVLYSVTKRQNALIDFDKKGIDWAIRLSPHYFNTIAEIDRLADILEEV